MKLIKNNWTKPQRVITSWLAGLVLAVAILGGLQYISRGHFSDPDGFYHARASQLLNLNQLHDTFPWLYFTTWNAHYADQHYLYHWLLSPFSTPDKLPISIVVFGVLFVGLFIATLKKYKVTFHSFWILILLAGSIDFLFRINLVKANTVSLALLCVITILMYSYHTGKRVWSLLGIGLVSALFVWTYGGFVCVPFLLGAYVAAVIISEQSFKISSLKFAILPVIVATIGIILGMILHPQSHNIWKLIYDQLFLTGLGAGTKVPAGNEWMPFNIIWFFQSNILVLFLWCLSIGLLLRDKALQWRDGQSKEQTLIWWLQIVTIGLMSLTLWHRRFVEYWIPFSVLASAVTIQPYINKLQWKDVKESLNFWQIKVGLTMVVGLIIFVSIYNINHDRITLQSGDNGYEYKSAAQWLEQNSQTGDIVLNTQWDQFPELFYFDSKNYYIVGLDPTFMYIQDQSKYWLWRKIADDKPQDWKSEEQVHQIIAKDLKSKFVFIDKTRNTDLYNYLSKFDAEKYFSISYDDEKFAIFYVK